MSQGLQCVKKPIVGATLGRPRILQAQNPSPQGEKSGYFPSENPKNYVFRRASKARPYMVYRNKAFFDSHVIASPQPVAISRYNVGIRKLYQEIAAPLGSQ